MSNADILDKLLSDGTRIRQHLWHTFGEPYVRAAYECPDTDKAHPFIPEAAFELLSRAITGETMPQEYNAHLHIINEAVHRMVKSGYPPKQ